MFSVRTDLALEAHEAEMMNGGEIEGVVYNESHRDGYAVKRVMIQNENGARRMGKPVGNYITIEAPDLRRDQAPLYRPVAYALKRELLEMMRLLQDDAVMVIGLGNRRITPDALGPRTADKLLATRHLVMGGARDFKNSFRSVCAFSPGVLGITGIDTTELTEVLTRAIKPALVIAVDALAARSASRLAATFQLSDTGVSPGSGVSGNEREISESALGVRVISIGVPTVMEAAALAADVADVGREDAAKRMEGFDPNMFVTPNNIDVLVEAASSIIALGLNCALHPALSPQEIESLMSN
ncbi:MAG: GPR endopeptidase [Clostridia bacterium]|nr:GPR endopeptidase [Clostridia bacterium]